MAKQRSTLKGAKRMKESGHKLVAVWLDPAELIVISRAAAYAGPLPLSTYIRRRAFGAAETELARRAAR